MNKKNFIEDPIAAYDKLLCDEMDKVTAAILINQLVTEIIRLEKCDLICPICKQELSPINYRGYYDRFACYVCDCEHFEFAEDQKGVTLESN